MRELDATFEHERPYFVMHEADEDRGGMPLHVLREDFASVRPSNAKLFSKSTPIITWHRVQDYQLSVTAIRTWDSPIRRSADPV